LFNNLSADNIPVIVIAPSKKAQSISTVGSSVTVYDQEYLDNNDDYFLGDILSDGSSINFNQSGGAGTISGIQLRGLPKAYSTVYIDGVKMSDNSTPKNDYYFDDILSNQISRVEILKGNQSSVYGSGAMGGTINITTKRGQPGFQKNFFYNTGSHGTHHLGFSLSGANDYRDFYIGLERYQTDGISAMSHNDEDDEYINNTLIANYGYKFSDKIKFTTNYRFAGARLDYDSANKDYPNDRDESHEKESTVSLGFSYKPNTKFTNSLNFSNAYISRTGNDIKDAYTNLFQKNGFWSYRDAVNYQGIYNFNLDNSAVFGIEKEWNEMDYEKYNAFYDAIDHKTGEEVVSQYIDFQSRLTNNLYVTVGIRFDEHSKAGREQSERISLAYLFNNKNTKLKTSFGTGIKYPSLYEFYKNGSSSSLKAEHGQSFDFGIEKSFPEKGIKFDVTYFNHKYEDMIEGQKRTGWKPQNVNGTVRSHGIELFSKYKLNNKLNFDLNYTYNSTYDGADFDDPNMGSESNGIFTNSQLVRIPRHLINLSTKVTLVKDLNITLQTKWSDSMRDYENINSVVGGDQRLKSFFVNDLITNYKLGNNYKIFLQIDNIFDEVYSTALDYNQMNRSFNLGIKRSY
jgi:vitamin B12 transporter